jgi:lysophospholipase L1-like esterase
MKFSLTGMLKGTAPEIAYLQVKLFKDKKAIKTFSSKRNTTQWDKVILNFSAQDADSMQVLCRFVHGKKNIGQKVYFADIKLEKLKVIIALVGDSTVADYPVNYIQRGWGQMLPEYVNEDVGVINNAIPGCSTKTFLKGNHWDKTLEAKPDFILLQFGHNDSHRKGRPESTDANTDYKEYLRKYADDAKTNGTTIIFVTPMHRHIFKKGKLSENLKPYADAMKDVAKEKGIAVVDLYSLSGKALTEKGDEGSLYLFKNGKDRTHFCKAGATLMAELVVNELKKQKNTIAECFK